MNIDIAKQAATALARVLQAKGEKSALGLLLLASAHETGGYNSHVSKVNNLTGIKYSAKSAIKGEYNSGIKSPEGNSYSGFDTVDAWANRYYNILSRGGENSPLKAKSVPDFAERLKGIGYYTDTVENYTNALNSWKGTISRYFKDIPFPIAATTSGLIVIILILLTINFIKNGSS